MGTVLIQPERRAAMFGAFAIQAAVLLQDCPEDPQSVRTHGAVYVMKPAIDVVKHADFDGVI
jgi:hypothetical protein